VKSFVGVQITLYVLHKRIICSKSWVKDVMEAVKPSGVPSDQRLIGTDAYKNYAETMVPGQSKPAWGRQFINKYKKKKS